MALIPLKINGLQNLLNKMDAASKDSVLKRALNKSALNLTAWVKRKRLSGPRPKFLGVVSGRLRSSIGIVKATKAGNIYTSKIGTNVSYARKHELGEGVRPRPFLRPAIEDRQNRRDTLKIIIFNIQKAIDTA